MSGTSILWNNEPAPFGSLSAIFWGKYFWEQKKFLRGKIRFFEKKNCDFGPKWPFFGTFGQNRPK